jgi:hypothetical protein
MTSAEPVGGREIQPRVFRRGNDLEKELVAGHLSALQGLAQLHVLALLVNPHPLFRLLWPRAHG